MTETVAFLGFSIWCHDDAIMMSLVRWTGHQTKWFGKGASRFYMTLSWHHIWHYVKYNIFLAEKKGIGTYYSRKIPRTQKKCEKFKMGIVRSLYCFSCFCFLFGFSRCIVVWSTTDQGPDPDLGLPKPTRTDSNSDRPRPAFLSVRAANRGKGGVDVRVRTSLWEKTL